MLTQVPAKILYEQQMDFDILPFDALASANVEDGLLRVNEETYKALLVPGCAALPEALLAILQRLEMLAYRSGSWKSAPKKRILASSFRRRASRKKQRNLPLCILRRQTRFCACTAHSGKRTGFTCW